MGREARLRRQSKQENRRPVVILNDMIHDTESMKHRQAPRVDYIRDPGGREVYSVSSALRKGRITNDPFVEVIVRGLNEFQCLHLLKERRETILYSTRVHDEMVQKWTDIAHGRRSENEEDEE